MVDHCKFARAFGAQPTPYEPAIDQTLAWVPNRDGGLSRQTR